MVRQQTVSAALTGAVEPPDYDPLHHITVAFVISLALPSLIDPETLHPESSTWIYMGFLRVLLRFRLMSFRPYQWKRS